MYYLAKKQFKPAMFLFGFIFIPCIIGLFYAYLITLRYEILFILFIISFIYFIIIFVLFKISNKKNHYLLLKETEVKLKFFDSIVGESNVELKFEQILKFDYYRINSIRGWFLLYSYVFPKSVYISYKIDKEVQTKFIGYLDLNDIKEIANKTNTELNIY